MDSVKGTCKCKNYSETDLIIAIREKPLERWGCLTWLFTIFMIIITWGGWTPLVVAWVLGKYFLSPVYRCQFCSNKLNKEQFR